MHDQFNGSSVAADKVKSQLQDHLIETYIEIANPLEKT
jgi:hypothetical protein